MKNNRTAFLIVLIVLLVIIGSCNYIIRLAVEAFIDSSVESAFTVDQEEMKRSTASINQGRPENAELLPDLAKNISDVRMTIVQRPYYAPAYEEDFQNLSIMQIWYGYYADGIWYDHPCENYDLSGILKDSERMGWEAAVGSHAVKIGPYLLICICVQENPTEEYHISDTLNSPVLQPFEEYNTYHYYTNENGGKHFYMDTHDHGYGYIAEDPSAISDPETAVCILQCEFERRYYLILDYDSLPNDYVLTIQQTSSVSEKEETYILSYDMIVDPLYPGKQIG